MNILQDFSNLTSAGSSIGQTLGLLPQSTNNPPSATTGSASNNANTSGSAQTGGSAPAVATTNSNMPLYIGGGIAILLVIYLVLKK